MITKLTNSFNIPFVAWLRSLHTSEFTYQYKAIRYNNVKNYICLKGILILEKSGKNVENCI